MSVVHVAKLRDVWEWFFVPKRQEDSAQGFNPDHYTQFVGGKRSPSATLDCLEKHRSVVRTKYRLEAYADDKDPHIFSY
jgi:hypothetical protein